MEAISLLIHYGSTAPTPAPAAGISPPSKYLPLSRDAFLAKVGFDNHASIRLFERLGFQEVKRSEIWREVELRPTKAGMSLGPALQETAVQHWALSL
jgi:hypothetical protein